MWQLKIKADVSKFLMGSYCKKDRVTLVGYPITYQKKGNFIILLTAGQVFGNDENIKNFIRSFKKDKNVLNLEFQGNFLIALQKQPKDIEFLYNPAIFWTEAQTLRQDGTAIWNLASFDKKALDRVVQIAEKYFCGKILSFKDSKISYLSLVNIIPSLTKKQKQAIELADKNKYYEVPRKIELVKLAKLMNVSLSTYQVHLRKAEQKLIPYMLKNLYL